MAMEIEFDLAKFERALREVPEVVFKAAKRGMHDVLDEWRQEAVDIAPLDKGTLRRGIDTRIDGNGLDMAGEINAVAIEDSGRGRFNYAYYLHEVKGEIANPTTPGTEAKFLDIPAEKHGNKWMRDIEAEIADELKRNGW
ncbi:HK97 gp10 family phage protein [Brevibacillus agri]|uniref:HK97 gp10 family phage protein n=1 Tax=Brevibacillus agri TaxID=51101 RepID=UPI001EE61021|nr:HK97 gp10 family phage protein [Brevibacillus agri]MCG5252621.1 HK97 gp10 family phage protein [Brevibacillus agri]